MAILEKMPACKTRNHRIYLTENTESCRVRTGRAGFDKTLHALVVLEVYFLSKLMSTEKSCVLLQANNSRVHHPTGRFVKEYCTGLLI